MTIKDKWRLLPMLVSPKGETFDKGSRLWGQFCELVNLRDEFVHPKHVRPAYYEYKGKNQMTQLDVNNIPKDLKAKAKDLVFPQTQIPKDPYAIRIPHVNIVKSVVDQMVDQLDALLESKIKAGNWYMNDTMTLVYPEGATLEAMDKNLVEAVAKAGKVTG